MTDQSAPVPSTRPTCSFEANAASRLPRATALATLLLAAFWLGGLGSAAHAQDAVQALTLEELEAHIAEQKAELEEVVENRDITEQKAEAIERELAEREAKQAEVEAEMRSLCQEREEIEPGTLDDCLAALEG